MNNFGQEVRRLRKEKMLTQRELAILLGVTPTYISKIENNNFEVLPSESVITNLAHHLDCEADTLLELAGKIDVKSLQEKAMEDPDTAFILRRIQKGLSKDKIQKLADEIKEDDD